MALAVVAAFGTSMDKTDAFILSNGRFAVDHRYVVRANSRVCLNEAPKSSNLQDLSMSDLIPFSGVTYDLGNVSNDGPFAWMVTYLNLIGFKEGNTLVGAMPTSPTKKLSDEEALAMREKATEELTNIGPEERERRAKLGKILLVVAAGYAAISAIFLDDGSITGHLAKFAVVAPLFFGRGFQLSAESGL